MKIFSAALLLALSLLISPNAAYAQEKTSALSVAVININAIRQNALAVKSISDQIQNYRTAFQAEIQKEEEVLRGANQELSRQRTLLSAEAFAEKRREFEQRVSQVQRMVQQRKSNLDRVQAESMGKVQDALNKIVSDIATEKSYNLILRRDQTVLVSKELDITEPVLAALNKNLVSVVVNEPAK